MQVRGIEIEHDACQRVFILWTHYEVGAPRVLLQVAYSGSGGRQPAQEQAQSMARVWADVFRVETWESAQTRH